SISSTHTATTHIYTLSLHDALPILTAPGGDATILHPTSLTLRERRISIIGGNGSGKSTLARLLNGLIEPSAGTVTVTAEETSARSEEHTSELQSRENLVCRLLLEKK